MSAVNICSEFGAQKNKVTHCFHCFPIYLPWSDGTRSQYHSVVTLINSIQKESNIPLGLNLQLHSLNGQQFSNLIFWWTPTSLGNYYHPQSSILQSSLELCLVWLLSLNLSEFRKLYIDTQKIYSSFCSQIF